MSTTLAARLAEALRDKPGATQADLARACGVRAPSVHAWFTGRTKSLKGTTLINAAAFLGVRPTWLAEGKGPKRDEAVDAHGNADLQVIESDQAVGMWPFKSIPYATYASLSEGKKRRLEERVADFIAGAQEEQSAKRSA